MNDDSKQSVDAALVQGVFSAPGRGERFQGNPCKYGHSGIRYRKCGTCVECAIAYAKARKQQAKQP